MLQLSMDGCELTCMNLLLQTKENIELYESFIKKVNLMHFKVVIVLGLEEVVLGLEEVVLGLEVVVTS